MLSAFRKWDDTAEGTRNMHAFVCEIHEEKKSLPKKDALKSLEKGDLTLNIALRIRLPVAFHNGLFLSELDMYILE